MAFCPIDFVLMIFSGSSRLILWDFKPWFPIPPVLLLWSAVATPLLAMSAFAVRLR
jgi:hypothetical protein